MRKNYLMAVLIMTPSCIASVDGSIHVSQLASVLNVWIPPRDEGTHRITAEKIEHALADLQLEHKADLSCAEFVSLCDYLS